MFMQICILYTWVRLNCIHYAVVCSWIGLHYTKRDHIAYENSEVQDHAARMVPGNHDIVDPGESEMARLVSVGIKAGLGVYCIQVW